MAGPGRACGGRCRQMPWVRGPMKRLYPGIFSFHFRNLLYASGRKCSYLCFQVKRTRSPSPVPSDRGVFRNQFHENESYHAELCFLSWFHAKKLSPDEHYRITWFLSWSPCAACAEVVARFLRTHQNVQLSIFAARLYYFWLPAFRWGLQKLNHAGAQVAIMSYQDFNNCWKKFVYNRRMRFKCWKKVHKNSKFLSDVLQEILSC